MAEMSLDDLMGFDFEHLSLKDLESLAKSAFLALTAKQEQIKNESVDTAKASIEKAVEVCQPSDLCGLTAELIDAVLSAGQTKGLAGVDEIRTYVHHKMGVALESYV